MSAELADVRALAPTGDALTRAFAADIGHCRDALDSLRAEEQALAAALERVRSARSHLEAVLDALAGDGRRAPHRGGLRPLQRESIEDLLVQALRLHGECGLPELTTAVRAAGRMATCQNPHGNVSCRLTSLIRRGKVERVARGRYRLVEAAP